MDDIEKNRRVKHITQLIEAEQMTPDRREDMVGQLEMGVRVNDDLIVWGIVPEDEFEDETFAIDLVDRARKQASKQE